MIALLKLDYIDPKYVWNCLVLLQDWLNIVKPKIAKEILDMCKLLEVEYFMAQGNFEDDRVAYIVIVEQS
jgi:hypothetical protein